MKFIMLSSISLKLYDRQQLEAARMFLCTSPHEYKSIPALARKVGINDFKLKKGFRQLYGCSVFSYVQRVRMQKAKILLQETTNPIADIAYLIGYNDPPNFTAAFKRYFGLTPSDMRKAVYS